MTDIVKLARGYVFDDMHRTHYNGCEAEHVSCLMGMLADQIERNDKWRDGVLDKITTIGYILGQHDGESLVDAAKRVTAEIKRLRAELERKSDTAVRNKWMAEVMQEEVKQLRADRDSFYMDYRMKCDEETKRQAAEIERLRNDRDHWREARRNAIEAGDELLREIERLRADAERYRWLRDHGVKYAICQYESSGPGEYNWCGWIPFDTRSTDAAIDAAMKEERK